MCRGASYPARDSWREGNPDDVPLGSPLGCARDHFEGTPPGAHFKLPSRSLPFPCTHSGRQSRTWPPWAFGPNGFRHVIRRCQFPDSPTVEATDVCKPGRAKSYRHHAGKPAYGDPEHTKKEEPLPGPRQAKESQSSFGNEGQQFVEEPAIQIFFLRAKPSAPKASSPPRANAGGKAATVAIAQPGQYPAFDLWERSCLGAVWSWEVFPARRASRHPSAPHEREATSEPG